MEKLFGAVREPDDYNVKKITGDLYGHRGEFLPIFGRKFAPSLMNISIARNRAPIVTFHPPLPIDERNVLLDILE